MKPEYEFFAVTDVEWTAVADSQCSGLSERILARAGAGRIATRLLRFEPGTDTTPNGTLTHDFWEEVYILEGTLYDIELGRTFVAGMYACRPPGMPHGPWTTTEGCVTFEVRYSAH